MGNGEPNESVEVKIAKMETKLEILTKTFTEGIERLEKKLERREENYVTKDILDEKQKLIFRDIKDLQDTVKTMQKEQFTDGQTKKQAMPNWIMVLVASASLLMSAASMLVVIYK